MEYVDSHCHFDFTEFDADRKAVWQACHNTGVRQLLIPGTEPEQWQRARDIAGNTDGVYFSVGVHPWWLRSVFSDKSENEHAVWQKMKEQAQHPLCLAIGECGLDKLKTEVDIDHQIVSTIIHIELANQLNLPVIFHCVKAHNELIKILKENPVKAGGVVHAFAGSEQIANTYIDMGLMLGIGGTITYERAIKTREAVAAVPLKNLLLETDAPDMPICGEQGERNSPENIPVIAKVLSDIRSESVETIARQTTENFEAIFGGRRITNC